jgi:hypothetical protein
VPIVTTAITDLDDFKALDPFFRIIRGGLRRARMAVTLTDGGDIVPR